MTNVPQLFTTHLSINLLFMYSPKKGHYLSFESQYDIHTTLRYLSSCTSKLLELHSNRPNNRYSI